MYKEMVCLRGALKHAGNRFRGNVRALVPEIKNVYVPRKRHLKPLELPKLLNQLPPKRRTWVLLAVYAGAPRSPALERIVWEEHVDLDAGWLEIPGTKTTAANRVVPIHPFLAE